MASSHHNLNSSANHCIWCIMCRVWWKLFAWVPVVLIVAVVTWSYYAYVIQLCFGMVTSMTQSVCYLIFFHIFLIMFIWAYWQTIFSWPQPVPSKFRLAESDMEALLAAANEEGQRAVLEYFAKNLPVVTRTMSGSIRYCNRCILVKPDRAHHCSMCGKCVLKMDHHCPWVNNCVNFHNYKFFILFLGYSLLYCIFIATSVLPYFISFWKAPDPAQGLGRFHVVFVFFVALMFTISLGSLFGYHLYLIIHNRSTLEAFRAPMFRGGPDKNGFSLGYYKNFVQVFGENKLLWLLPVFTSVGNGSEYPVRREHQLQNYVVLEQRSYDAMGSVRSSEPEDNNEVETWRLCGGIDKTAPQIV